MQIILSPSKTQSFSYNYRVKAKAPVFLDKANYLAEILKSYTKDQLAKLMNISSKLAEQSWQNFQNWDIEHLPSNSTPAIHAYKGAVYSGFELEGYSSDDFDFLNSRVNILSGLYGVLAALDLIKPYRLDVGQKLEFVVDKKKYVNLYEYWGKEVNGYLAAKSQSDEVLLNLASNEYSKMISKKSFNFVEVDFKVLKDDKLKTIGIYAKQQRGRMANWIVKNRISDIKSMEKYRNDGFVFSEFGSSPSKLLFIKKL